MRTKSQILGFTLIEVLIYMAVTGALLVSGLLLISGRQSRTEFSLAVNDLDALVRDTINRVSSGYYPNTQDVYCRNPLIANYAMAINQAGTKIGTNQDCLVVGKVIQFQASGGGVAYEQYLNVLTLIGRRKDTSAPSQPEVSTLAQTNPAAVTYRTIHVDPVLQPLMADVTEGSILQNGLRITAVKDIYCDKNPLAASCATRITPFAGVGFFSSFGQYNGNDLISNASNVSISVVNIAPNVDKQGAANAIVHDCDSNLTHRDTTPPPCTAISLVGVQAPQLGIALCLIGQNNKTAQLTIGGPGNDLGSLVEFDIRDASRDVCP